MPTPPPTTPDAGPTDAAATADESTPATPESDQTGERATIPDLSTPPGPIRRAWRGFVGRVKRLLWTAVLRTTGRRIQPSARFEDLTHVAGMFDADATVARRIVPDAFEVVEVEADRTLVTIAAYDYRRVNVIGPYREVAINVPVRYRGDDVGEPGTYVLAMPVTTDEARWAGRLNAGFPKLLGDVEMAATADGVTSRLSLAGQHVLTLEVDATPTAETSGSGRVFNVRDGTVTVSEATLSGSIGEGTEPGGARLALGAHPLADLLRALDVGPTSRYHAYTPQGAAVLESSTDLGPAVGAAAPAAEANPGESTS